MFFARRDNVLRRDEGCKRWHEGITVTASSDDHQTSGSMRYWEACRPCGGGVAAGGGDGGR